MTDAPIQILLVEDSAADAVLMKEALAETKHGHFAMTHVKRLDEALGKLDREQFDVVLLDLGLPDSQGLQTLERVQRQSRLVPVVVMTGLADEALALRALHQGAQDYLVKGDTAGGMIVRAIRWAIERKTVEELALQREAELAHLSRVSTMGQMASGLAHELNQPLGAILNYASACLTEVESETGSREKMRTALGEIMSETRRAGTIISRLRSFVRKQQPQSKPLDVNELVEESIQLLGFELRHQGIRPKLRLAEKLPKVLADAIQIEQVLVNLIYNALEAMGEPAEPPNGLTLETTLQPDGRGIEIAVIDSGAGVAPENMGRLFDPFFTTKATGMGMGLNISRSIVENHGGRLAAVANPDSGMRFSFTLPVMEGAAR